MGTKLNPGTFDCYRAALLDEPQFILNARDPDMPETIRFWITLRQARIARGEKPQSDMGMLHEAAGAATDAAAWREENRMVTIPQTIAGVEVDPFVGCRWHFEAPPSIDDINMARLNEVVRLNDTVRRLTGENAALRVDVAEIERLKPQEIVMERRIAELEEQLRAMTRRAFNAEGLLAGHGADKAEAAIPAGDKYVNLIHGALGFPAEDKTIAQALLDFIASFDDSEVVPIYACDIRGAIESARGEHMIGVPQAKPAYSDECRLPEEEHLNSLCAAEGFGETDEAVMLFIKMRPDDSPVHILAGDLKQALACAYGRGRVDTRTEIVTAVCNTLGVDHGDMEELYESRRDQVTRELGAEAAEASARFRRSDPMGREPETISVPRDILLQALREDEPVKPLVLQLAGDADAGTLTQQIEDSGLGEVCVTVAEYRDREELKPAGYAFEKWGYLPPLDGDARKSNIHVARFVRLPPRWTVAELFVRDVRYVASLSEGARNKVKEAIICCGAEDLAQLVHMPLRWPRMGAALDAIERWHEKVLEAEAAEPEPCGPAGMGRGLDL